MDQVPLILVVDDDPNFLEIFSSKLTASGFRAVTAKDGEEGLMKIRSLRPDLVLLDMQMPVKTGADVIADIKKDPATKDMRVVFISSAGSTDPLSVAANEKFSREIGAEGYIYKTDDLDAVALKVRAFLR